MAVTTSAPDGADLPKTRSAWATERLRSAILLAELEPGEEIREVRLAREWGLSPTPLREALRTLAAEGLVVQQPQRVSRVAELSREKSIEVYALRLVLEPLALRMSLAQRPPGREEEVGTACAALAAAAEEVGGADGSADHGDYERTHRAFHRLLVSDCGSSALLDVLDILWARSMRFRYVALKEAQQTREATNPQMLYAGHDRLRDTYLAGDPDVACRELSEHISGVLLEMLDEHELARVARLREELPALTGCF